MWPRGEAFGRSLLRSTNSSRLVLLHGGHMFMFGRSSFFLRSFTQQPAWLGDLAHFLFSQPSPAYRSLLRAVRRQQHGADGALLSRAIGVHMRAGDVAVLCGDDQRLFPRVIAYGCPRSSSERVASVVAAVARHQTSAHQPIFLSTNSRNGSSDMTQLRAHFGSRLLQLRLPYSSPNATARQKKLAPVVDSLLLASTTVVAGNAFSSFSNTVVMTRRFQRSYYMRSTPSEDWQVVFSALLLLCRCVAGSVLLHLIVAAAALRCTAPPAAPHRHCFPYCSCCFGRVTNHRYAPVQQQQQEGGATHALEDADDDADTLVAAAAPSAAGSGGGCQRCCHFLGYTVGAFHSPTHCSSADIYGSDGGGGSGGGGSGIVGGGDRRWYRHALARSAARGALRGVLLTLVSLCAMWAMAHTEWFASTLMLINFQTWFLKPRWRAVAETALVVAWVVSALLGVTFGLVEPLCCLVLRQANALARRCLLAYHRQRRHQQRTHPHVGAAPRAAGHV